MVSGVKHWRHEMAHPQRENVIVSEIESTVQGWNVQPREIITEPIKEQLLYMSKNKFKKKLLMYNTFLMHWKYK